MTKNKGKHSGLSKAVSLTLVMAMGSRAAWGTDLTLYGTEHYSDAIVVSVTQKQTLIWDSDHPRMLANNNFWGKTREVFGNPNLFELPAKVKLTDGTVLKSAQVQAFDQYGLTIWDGNQERHCLYTELPPTISTKYPFTDATRAEYRTQYLKFQEINRVAKADSEAREQAAAAAQAQAARDSAQAQADADAAAARRDEAVKIAKTAGVVLLLGLAAKAILGNSDSSSESSDAEAQEKEDQQRFSASIMRQNRERYEKEDLERRQALEESQRQQRAREQEELMSHPRY